MRFEKLLWTVLVMFLASGAWQKVLVVDATADSTAESTFEAADSGTDVPPPRP